MNKFIIGITGPTGAGKSTWTKAFSNINCRIIDCDKLARIAVEDRECIKQLINTFGKEIYSGNRLNRRLLAKKAFENNETVQKLNNITHPIIKGYISKQLSELSRTNCNAIILDAPLLYESNLNLLCNKCYCVLVPVETRIDRLIKRDNITREEILKRIAVQQDDDFYISNSDEVLDGTLSAETIRQKVYNIINDIKETV